MNRLYLSLVPVLYYIIADRGLRQKYNNDFSGHVRTFPAFLDVVQLTETETCPV